MTFTLLALILAAEPVTAPPLVPADEVVQRISPQPLKYVGTVPEGYQLVERPNWVPIGIGIGLFAGAYVPWAVVGTMQGQPENAVPLVGPILGFRAATGWFSTFVNSLAVTMIAVDMAAQFAGVITFIVGLATPKRGLERAVPSISFVPGATGADVGASVVGRF